jgi:hypothetical protein
MFAVLHLGEFDGAEFDMRTWTKVPDVVFARRGGTGELGVLLSQKRKPGSTAYRFVSEQPGNEFHYRIDDGSDAETLEFFVHEPMGASA